MEVSSAEIMEASEIETPNKVGVESSPQVESNEKESLSGMQSSHVQSSPVQQTSQEISSQVIPSSTPVVSSQVKSSHVASSPLPSTSSEALLSSLSSDMENGPAQKKPRLDFKSMSSGVYLDSTVVPILHVALVTLDRLRPEDPVQFVIDFLLRNKAQYSKKIPSETSTNQA